MIKFIKPVLLLSFISITFSNSVYAQNNDKSNNYNPVQQSNAGEQNNDYQLKSRFPISVINPSPSINPIGAYYPGYRGANQLNIYTPEYGVSTGTNEFGKEATVMNGVVTDFSGANSVIPQNGFIISGHGRAKSWITSNLAIGAKVQINKEKKTIESLISPESYIFKANQRINDATDTLNEYKQSSKKYQAKEAQFLLTQANQKLKQSNIALEKKDYEQVQKLANCASDLADKAFYNIISAIPNEFHGIWIRPTEKNRDEIVTTLDKIQKAGIDNVFLETYYQGYTIFPSKTLEKYGVLEQKKEFKGWNPLQVWTEEAHNRNMKIHVWFQTFYTGNEDISKNCKNVISVHPDWANLQKKNYASIKPMPSISEHNGYFLDPANPAVQQYLTELLQEITTDYKVDGLNIDYIRYPASLLPSFPAYVDTTWGYTAVARSEFESLYGVDPTTINTYDPLWTKWNEYRQQKVTDFVSKLKSVTAGKNIMISTVVFPDSEESSILKLQNWQVWGQNKFVDAFTPLIMGSGENLIKDYVTKIKSSTNNQVQVIPGLFQAFTGDSPIDMLHQIKSARSAETNGFIIFDYAHLNCKYAEAISTRAFKQELQTEKK